MIDDRNLTEKYKEMQQQKAPDLWNRIESGLVPVERSERVAEDQSRVPSGNQPHEISPDRKHDSGKAGRRYRRYGWIGAAAAVFGVVVIGSRLMLPEQDNSLTHAGAVTEAEAVVAAEDTAPAWEAEPDTALAEAESSSNFQSQESAESDVILLKANLLQVPADARTVPYDAEYFSEDILRETNLLCGAVITDVSFVYNGQGEAVNVKYEMTVSDVHYAEEYVAGMDEITVLSPIIETAGDEAYLLYQMQVGSHYLLPLAGSQGSWELLYPFAPQIEVLDHDYKFHSGYASLITNQTEVTKGTSAGENDFYYDRMLVRHDDQFIADLISLMK